jgi:hypothetical protein
MAYRLAFHQISLRSNEQIDRGYEVQAVRDNGIATLRLSGILSEEMRIALIGQAPFAGVGLPADTEKPVDDLLLLFTVSRFERALRNGSLALAPGEEKSSALTFNVKRDDFPEIFSGSSRKECTYRLAKGRDFYCCATREEPVTRITPALCRECPVPDARWICSHLAHPASGIEFGADEECQCSPRAMCNVGRPEIERLDSCRPGGNKCWERLVEPEAAKRSRVFVPEALPEALDFLHATWCLAFGKKRRLLRLRSATDTTTLVASCNTRKDFVACMSALDDAIKSMRIDDEVLAEGDLSKDETKGDKTLNRLEACLRNKVADLGQREAGIQAVAVLRSANRIRVALQHSGRSEELPKALAALDLSSTDDWAACWTAVREHVTEALVDLRRAIAPLVEVD